MLQKEISSEMLGNQCKEGNIALKNGRKHYVINEI